jgi:hypothetical protein
LVTIPKESYLRGVQVSDENGKLDFVTISPAVILAAGRTCIWTLHQAPSGSIQPFSQITRETDQCFGDNTPAQNAAIMPKMKGSIDSGYVAAATVGIAA